jgi:hypothetical protein
VPGGPTETSVPSRASQREELLVHIQHPVPRGAVPAGFRRATAVDMLDHTDVATVAAILGRGHRTSAQATVPFALSAAARYTGDFREARWRVISAGGDVSTTCGHSLRDDRRHPGRRRTRQSLEYPTSHGSTARRPGRPHRTTSHLAHRALERKRPEN